MEQQTHDSIAPGLRGRPVALGAGRARGVIETTTTFLGPVVAPDTHILDATAPRQARP